MAVFPDRIVLKNSTDSQASIEAAIATGGTDEIAQGEIVIGLEAGLARLYTRDASGNIVVVSGTGGPIDDLNDVDTTTVAPTNGQVLTWDGSQWEPATPTTSGLPGGQDGRALIWENGNWVAGPVIGGVDYDPSGGDTDFSSVSLLLLGNGSDGSTAFADSSSNFLTVTANGAAEISTAEYKFGGSSIHLPASSQGWLSIADNALLNLSGDFTVEAWFYITSSVVQYQTIIGSSTSSWTTGAVHMYVDNGVLRVARNGSSELVGTASIANNTWYHVALTRSGTSVTLFVNGVIDATQTNSAVFSFNDNGTLIGKNGWDGSSTRFNGYIDDLRVTKGVARYTAAFTPPTAELPATGPAPVTIPYSIDKLDDVDTSTVPPTDGQLLAWDNTAGQWEPADLQGTAVRTALGIGEYADDTAAGTGGVASGALYYNTTSSDYRLKS